MWESINVYLKSLISKKERDINLSETRLSEAVSTNLMQLGLLKDSFDALLKANTKIASAWALFSDSQKVLNISGEG